MKVVLDLHRQIPAGQEFTICGLAADGGGRHTIHGPGELRVLMTERGERRVGPATRRARGDGGVSLSRRAVYYGRRIGDPALHKERRRTTLGDPRAKRANNPLGLWLGLRKGDDRRDPHMAAVRYTSSNDPRIVALERRRA